MAKLILRGEQGEREIPLEQGKSVTIGRSPECDLPIDDNQASRNHCRVQEADGGWEVADLGSTNGTLVNSTLTKKQTLYDGDVIRIGACEIAYSNPTATRSTGGDGAFCSLVYAKGARKGQQVELREQRTTIGRKNSNTIVLEDTVASSYHCEIVRDLNGYTLRDLGSTNGTLLNNEMVTEAALTHGARIRIGNTRLVFQDPAMAAVDLDLAGGGDDEEAEWGMMRELDLAAVRKRNPATLVYAVLFIGILGAGGWFLTQKPKVKAAGPKAPKGNLHAPWSFEDAGAEFTWESEPPDSVAIRQSKSTKGQGKASLELRSSTAQSAALYASSILGAGRSRYKLSGKVAARGGSKARLGILWEGSGLSAWATAPPIDGGGLKTVTLTSSAPPWARSARIGVRIEGEGTVFVDDVALVAAGAADKTTAESGNFRMDVTDGRFPTFFNSDVPILIDGRPIALDASGNELDATAMQVVAKEAGGHLQVMISGAPEAAARVGVRFRETGQYLSRGGFRAFGDAEDGSTYFVSAFPDEGTRSLERVRKLLVGPPGRACAVIGAAEGVRNDTIATIDGRRRYWTILGKAEGGAFAFRIKTDLTADAAEATKRISASISLHEQRRWGDFLDESDRVLAEFPFANETLRRRIAQRASQVRAERAALGDKIESLLDDYREFKDLKSLDDVEQNLKTLRGTFQIEAGKGTWGERISTWASRAATAREEALRGRQKQRAEERMALAEFVFMAKTPPAVYSGAVVYAYVTRYLEQSPSAPKAKAALEQIKKKHPRIAKVLGGMKFGEDE